MKFTSSVVVLAGLAAFSLADTSLKSQIEAMHKPIDAALKKRDIPAFVMEGCTMGPDKKSHKMALVGTSTDTCRKVKGKWKMSSMTMKTDKMTMDGKPMPIGKGKM